MDIYVKATVLAILASIAVLVIEALIAYVVYLLKFGKMQDMKVKDKLVLLLAGSAAGLLFAHMVMGCL